MATEYGLFSDEGLVEGGFYTLESAQESLAESYSEEDGLEIHEICPDHPDHARCSCEVCNADEEDECDEEEDEEECLLTDE